jgi:hypothetical protein
MNHSILSANRTTHLKIVLVSLMAAILVVSIGIAARVSTSGVELAGVHPQSPATAGVVKANRPVVWTDVQGTTIR